MQWWEYTLSSLLTTVLTKLKSSSWDIHETSQVTKNPRISTRCGSGNETIFLPIICGLFAWFRIERSLCDHIMTLRSQFITRWNRHCTRILQTLLPILEENKMLLSHECHNQLAEIKSSYRVSKSQSLNEIYVLDLCYLADLCLYLFFSW